MRFHVCEGTALFNRWFSFKQLTLCPKSMATLRFMLLELFKELNSNMLG